MLSSTGSHPARTAPTVLRWVFGALAPAWYVVTTFGALSLPNVAVVVVLGVLVALTVEPDDRDPHRGITATRRTLVLALSAVICFVPVAFGMDLLLGRIPIEPGHAVLATLAAVCVALPRLAETRVFATPAMLGRRELIIGGHGARRRGPGVPGGRDGGGDGRVRRHPAHRHGHPQDPSRRGVAARCSGAEPGRCRPRTSGSSSVLLGRGRPCPARSTCGVPTRPDAQAFVVGGVLGRPGRRRALLVAFPRRRISVDGQPCWPCSARSSSSSARRHRQRRHGTRSRSVFR